MRRRSAWVSPLVRSQQERMDPVTDTARAIMGLVMGHMPITAVLITTAIGVITAIGNAESPDDLRAFAGLTGSCGNIGT